MRDLLYETEYFYGVKYIVTEDNNGTYNIHKVDSNKKYFVIKCEYLMKAKCFADQLAKAFKDGYFVNM